MSEFNITSVTTKEVTNYKDICTVCRKQFSVDDKKVKLAGTVEDATAIMMMCPKCGKKLKKFVKEDELIGNSFDIEDFKEMANKPKKKKKKKKN